MPLKFICNINVASWLSMISFVLFKRIGQPCRDIERCNLLLCIMWHHEDYLQKPGTKKQGATVCYKHQITSAIWYMILQCFLFFFHARQGEILGLFSDATSYFLSFFEISHKSDSTWILLLTQWWSSLDDPADQTLSYELVSESLIFLGHLNIRGPTNPEAPDIQKSGYMNIRRYQIWLSTPTDTGQM